MVSRGCSPILGSSRIYSEPVRLLPNDVERLMRCDSPPDRVELNLSSVRYPSPTSDRFLRRVVISSSTLSALFVSYSSSSIFVKMSISESISELTKSAIVYPPTLTYRASLRSLLPPHSSQVVLPVYRAFITRYCILRFSDSRNRKKSFNPLKWLLPLHSSCFSSLDSR